MQHVGVIGGPLLTILIAAVTLYCFIILVDTKNFFHQKGRTHVNSFAEIGKETFGSVGSSLVNIAIVANQVGVVAAYQLFIGKNWKNMFPNDIPLPAWVMMWCVVLIPLCNVRQLKVFSYTSAFGLVSLVFTVVSVVTNGVLHSTPPEPLPLWPNDLFLFLGIAAFGYAGIAISISVENNMATPSHFPKMISAVFAVVTVVYCGFGVGTFYLYGFNIQSVISCNIVNPLGYAVKAALIIQLTFGTPLNTHPIWETIEPSLKRCFGDRWWAITVFRSIFVCLTAVIAFSVPYFGDFSNLVGAFATSFVTWILPPAFHLKAFGRSLGLGKYLADVACITFGLSVLVSSSAMTILNLIGEIEHPTAATC